MRPGSRFRFILHRDITIMFQQHSFFCCVSIIVLRQLTSTRSLFGNSYISCKIIISTENILPCWMSTLMSWHETWCQVTWTHMHIARWYYLNETWVSTNESNELLSLTNLKPRNRQLTQTDQILMGQNDMKISFSWAHATFTKTFNLEFQVPSFKFWGNEWCGFALNDSL